MFNRVLNNQIAGKVKTMNLENAIKFHFAKSTQTEEGYFTHPCQPGGQYQPQFATLWKEDGLESFINLAHVINIEQSILYREGDDIIGRDGNWGITVVPA